MTIDEVKQKKVDLENAINDLVDAFNDETETMVDDICVNYLDVSEFGISEAMKFNGVTVHLGIK